MYVLKRLVIKCDILYLSHIHLLITFVNALTPQPTEQFCLYCIYTGLGLRGGGIPLMEKNDKKHHLCKTSIPPHHPLFIINLVLT